MKLQFIGKKLRFQITTRSRCYKTHIVLNNIYNILSIQTILIKKFKKIIFDKFLVLNLLSTK